MYNRTPILALVALAAGLAVGLLAWLVIPLGGSDSDLATIDGDNQIGRSVGEPSSPSFGRDTDDAPPVALPSVAESGEFQASSAQNDDDSDTSTNRVITPAFSGEPGTSLPSTSSAAASTDGAATTAEPSRATSNTQSSASTSASQSGTASTNSGSSSTASSGSGSNTTGSNNSSAANSSAGSSTTSGGSSATTPPATQPTRRAPATTAAPRSTTPQAPATTVAPSVPTTTAPVAAPVQAAPNAISSQRSAIDPSSSVYVSPNGNDSNQGTSQSPVGSLDRALDLASAGDSIVFTAGTHDALRITGVNGTERNPIRIVGAPGSEFRSSSYSREAGILVRDSTNIEIVDVNVRHALWGVYIQNSHGIDLLDSDIRDIGQEVVRIKDGSSNILVEGNMIADSGRRTDNDHANGEGVYIGTGTPSNVDHVSNVTVRNNTITRLTDEAIDIKIPSTNVVIEGNTITDINTQTSGAIVVHLNSRTVGNPNITIEANIVRDVTRSSPYRDGNCIVAVATVEIINNVLHNCQHRGILVQGSSGTATIQHNTFIDTGELGTILNDGRGMSIDSKNNLGTDGSGNRQADESDFVNPDNFDYRVNSGSFDTASSVGVRSDLLGQTRPNGQVTYGAIER